MVIGCRYRTVTFVALCTWSVVAAGANQDLLRFTTVVRQQQDITVAEVIAGGEVLIRFRGTQAAQMDARARMVAQRLQQQALQGITGDQITVATEGASAQVQAGKNLLVAPDAQTARLSNTTVHSLAAQWATRLAAAFTPPYLVLDLDVPVSVPLGEARTVRYGGRFSETISVESAAPTIATISVDAASELITVEGKGRGNTQVMVTAGALGGQFEVICRPWAGRVNTLVEAHLTGRNPSAQTRRLAAINAILAGVTVAPGATASLSRLEDSDHLWTGRVALEGEGYFRREQQVAVQHRLVAAPNLPLDRVFVSNKPEKVTAAAVLMRENLPAGRSSRVLWHHVNRSTSPLVFTLRLLNASSIPSRVHILGAGTGPGRDEMYLGHEAMHRFWQLLLSSTGHIADVPVGRIWNAFEYPTRPLQLVSGMAQLTNLGPGDLRVELAAQSKPAPLPLIFPQSPPDASLSLSGFEYAAQRQIAVSHTIGGPWTFVRIGKHTDPDQLPGDYGVMYDIQVTLTNGHDTAQRFEIVVQAAGGATRGLYLIDGELVATGVLRPYQEHIISEARLPAQATRTITMKTIPQSGANYPVTLTVRSPRPR